MRDPSPIGAIKRPLSSVFRRVFHRIRTEGQGAARESAATALGVFIGCLPIYGFHLLVCTAVGTVLRLNRLKMYLAANISNPFVAPWLVFLEIQTGAWLRRRSFHALTIEAVKTTSLATVGADLLIGAVAIGAVLGGMAGWITYAVVRRSDEQNAFTDLVRLASDRYLAAGVIAWEFARGKIAGDPIYKAVVCGGLLTSPGSPTTPDARDVQQTRSGGTLLDIGCGQGLALSLLAEARRAERAGTWPAAWPSLPPFERMVGIEIRRRVAEIATAALGGDAEVIACDALATSYGPVQTVLLFDALHMMQPDQQDTLLASLAAALEPGGLMLIREADAAAGWRFTAVRWGNRMKALAYGDWRQPFHFRTASEWQECLARHGLSSEVRAMAEGTPFANVVLLVRPRQS